MISNITLAASKLRHHFGNITLAASKVTADQHTNTICTMDTSQTCIQDGKINPHVSEGMNKFRW